MSTDHGTALDQPAYKPNQLHSNSYLKHPQHQHHLQNIQRMFKN